MTTGTYIGAPDIFALDMVARTVAEAFDCYGVYLVGSALDRPDWRDVDVRMIMSNDVFLQTFPGAEIRQGAFSQHPRWVLLTTAISEYMKKVTRLPVDFQFQPQSYANKHHEGRRHPLGIRIIRSVDGRIR